MTPKRSPPRSIHHDNKLKLQRFSAQTTRGPLLATSILSFIVRGHSVLSVPPEPAASISMQNVPSKPSRPDVSRANGDFASLIDRNTFAADSNAPVPDQPMPPRRNEASAAPDSGDSRDMAPANNEQPPAATDDRDSATAQPAITNPPAKPAGKDDVPRTGTKAAPAKAGDDKSPGKTLSDPASAPDQGTANADAQILTAPNVVAVVIAAPTAQADSPTAPSSNSTSAPLALAAAAIAASASTTAQTAPQPQGKSTSDGGTATAAPAVATNGAASAHPAVAGEAVVAAVKQTAASADSDNVTGLAPAAPSALKVAISAGTVTAQAKAAGSAAQHATSVTPASVDASVTATPADVARPLAPQQQPLAGKQEGAPSAASGAKTAIAEPDTSGPAPAGSNHDPAASMSAVTSSGASPDANTQAISTIQTPLPAGHAAASQAANLSVTAASGAAVPLSGLAVEIAATARSGKTRFEVRLDPAELGRIDVRIDLDRNGQMISHLTVERPETLSMLQQDAQQLQRALDDAGLKTGSNGLQFSLRDQSSSGQNNGNNSGVQSQRLIISEDDAIPAGVAGRSYGRMLSGSGGVDIRV